MLDLLKVLAGPLQGAAVATEPVLLQAPLPRVGARRGQIREDLAGEAVLTDGGHSALHAGLVPGAPHAGGIDDEAPRLGVLEEGLIEVRLQGIGLLDDRLRVIGDQDPEDAVEEGPRRLARLDRRLRRLPQHRVDEAVAREDRREDPRPEAPAPARGIGRQVRHPAGVELDLFAGGAVGDRDRRGGPSEAQLGDREAPEGGVADVHALAPEELADLGQASARLEVRLNDGAIGGTLRPAVAMRPAGTRLDRTHGGGEQAVVEGVGTHLAPQAGGPRGTDVAPHGLDVEAQLNGDPLLGDAPQPQPQDFLELEHADLAIGHAPLPAPSGADLGHSARSREGGKLLKNPRARGPMLLKKSGRKGPYLLKTDTGAS